MSGKKSPEPPDDRTLDLFSVPPQITTPKKLARKGHPETSRQAAREVFARLPQLYEYVLAVVKLYPRSTASEMADREGQRDVRRIGRRLPELEKLGRVRRCGSRVCTITGKTATTWEAAT
jgi:hypothetical protein